MAWSIDDNKGAMTDRVYTLFPELQRDLHSLSFTTGILPSQNGRD